MGLFEKAILRTEKLNGEKNFEAKQVLHIGFGIDFRFALGMGVLMTSLILNNPKQKFVFHVFTDGIKSNDMEKLSALAQNDCVEINVYHINLDTFKKFPTSLGWSHATYYRFVMGEKLYGIAEKMLYLDADVLCVGSLESLLTIDMEDNVILGIDDHMTELEERLKNLSIKNKRYFNAGVMYIDIKKWHSEKITERAMQMIMENPQKYKSLDQDVLNVLLDGKTKYVGKEWDYIYNMIFMDHQLPNNVKLIHYTGDKPWQRWTEHHFMVKRYHEYMKKSPWGDIPLQEPVHYKEKRKMAKSCKKRGTYLEALKYYMDYLVTRTKSKMK